MGYLLPRDYIMQEDLTDIIVGGSSGRRQRNLAMSLSSAIFIAFTSTPFAFIGIPSALEHQHLWAGWKRICNHGHLPYIMRLGWYVAGSILCRRRCRCRSTHVVLFSKIRKKRSGVGRVFTIEVWHRSLVLVARSKKAQPPLLFFFVCL